MPIFRWELVLVLCLWASIVAAQEDPKTPEPPPPGVTVEMVAAPGDDAPGEGLDIPSPPTPEEGEPEVEFSYDGVPFGDVLDDLREQFDIIILCPDEELLEQKYYRHIKVPQSVAIAAICAPLFHYPRPAYIICTEDEVRDGELRPEIETEKRVNIKLEEAVLGEALDYASEVIDLRLAATQTVAPKAVSYEAQEAGIPQIVEGIAGELECAHTTGFVVEPIDFDKILGALDKLSDEDLEKMFREGLAKDGQGLGPGGGQAQMQDGMKMFDEMSPEERAQIISRAAGIIQRFGDTIRRLSPQTQADLKSRAQPALGLAVGGYLSLSAGKRAEFSPLMNALKSFGW